MAQISTHRPGHDSPGAQGTQLVAQHSPGAGAHFSLFKKFSTVPDIQLQAEMWKLTLMDIS